MNNNNITFRSNSGIYILNAELFVPISMDEAWSFFSNPKNLATITPDNMGFKITSAKSEKIYAGQIITYKVNIFPLIKSNWVTEITQIQTHSYFIDEQRFGPYRMWHHEHHFIETEGGVIMKDKIFYKIPFGILGRMVHLFFIKNQLKSIFSYRTQTLRKLFPIQ